MRLHAHVSKTSHSHLIIQTVPHLMRLSMSKRTRRQKSLQVQPMSTRKKSEQPSYSMVFAC
jgi:hypothetical protein